MQKYWSIPKWSESLTSNPQSFKSLQLQKHLQVDNSVLLKKKLFSHAKTIYIRIYNNDDKNNNNNKQQENTENYSNVLKKPLLYGTH